MALASVIHQTTETPVFAPGPPQGSTGKSTVIEKVAVNPYVAKFDLSQSLLEANHMVRPRRFADVLVSVVVHVLVLGIPIFLSLWFTNTIDLKAYTRTMLVGPPPPPPPPPPPAAARVVSVPHRMIFNQGKLLAPSFIPKEVAVLKEAPLDDALGGIEGGVPGGVPGGQMGGVLGGILGGATTKSAPPPPGKKAPVRVGGRVQSPRPIYTPAPEYPSLARMTKIQGIVTISAVLDEKGDVIEMKVVSGPVLLYKAALDAVARWKYQPTFLNGEPISVEMNIIVNFQLAQ